MLHFISLIITTKFEVDCPFEVYFKKKQKNTKRFKTKKA